MATVTNSFEGGTSGSTITTAGSGGTSGNAFDVVDAGYQAVWDNTQHAHGTLSGKFASTTTASANDVQWTTSIGSSATIWGRQYIYLTANPSANFRIMTVATSGGTTLCAAIYVTTTGTLLSVNTTGATLNTSTATINLNGWTRIEWKVIGSTTAGQVEFIMYKTMDSNTATETQTSVTTANTGGTPALYSFGMGFDTKASIGPFWLDDIGLSTTAYMGPAVTGLPPGKVLQLNQAVGRAANY